MQFLRQLKPWKKSSINFRYPFSLQTFFCPAAPLSIYRTENNLLLIGSNLQNVLTNQKLLFKLYSYQNALQIIPFGYYNCTAKWEPPVIDKSKWQSLKKYIVSLCFFSETVFTHLNRDIWCILFGRIQIIVGRGGPRGPKKCKINFCS